jgi:ATP-binding cassette subfamily G (WHITE) protein 2 (PDR)
VNPTVLPQFWIFIYRVSPITYFVNTMAAASLAGSDISCSSREVVTITVIDGQNCETFLGDYVQKTGARLLNPLANEACEVCPVASTDGLLNTLGIAYSERWRDLAITLCYLVVNVLGAMLLYRIARIRKRSKGGLSHTAVSLGRHKPRE